MKYSDMVIYLSDHSIEQLAFLLKIPRPTLSRFLARNGYKSSALKVEKKEKRLRINSLDILGVDSQYNTTATLTDLQKQIVHGSLFGDMYAGWTSERSVYLKCEHTWSQINYLKALYELLRPFSFSAYLDYPQKGFQDYQVGFSCHSSPEFKPFREKFYTIPEEGSPHLQRYILGSVIDELTEIGLAFWIMDDGKRYGAAFGISIGKGPHYPRSKIDEACQRINDRFRTDFRVDEGKLGFLLYVTKGSSIIDRIRDYILPDMAYKLRLMPEDCGSFYRDFQWYQEWQEIRSSLIHPHLQKNPYSKSYYGSLKGNEKKRYDISLYAQVKVRGFPFPSKDKRDISESFDRLKEKTLQIKDNVLIYNHSFNHIANHFMSHRFKLNVRGHKSPYKVFYDNKLLKATLLKQLIDGPALNNSNIRAAISVYKTQAVGQFNVLYAKYFCDTYCPDKGIVIDPCAGFGARMVGCAASGRSYIGIEPASETVGALNQLAKWLRPRSMGNISIIKACAENMPVNFCDMAITSPPYFNVEEYSYESTQSFMRYRNYDQWVLSFLGPLIKSVYKILRRAGVFVLNIDDVGRYHIQEDAIKIAKACGFCLEDTFFSGALHRPASYMTSEPYFILRK